MHYQYFLLHALETSSVLLLINLQPSQTRPLKVTELNSLYPGGLIANRNQLYSLN